jgi:hypothetical protein
MDVLSNFTLRHKLKWKNSACIAVLDFTVKNNTKPLKYNIV